MKLMSLFLAASVALSFSLAGDAEAANKNSIKSAVTQQTSKVNPRDKNKIDGIVEVVTVSNSATRLELKSVSTPRKAKYLGVKVTNCKATGGRCKQRFYMSFDGGKSCNLDGKYALNFQVHCKVGTPLSTCTPGPHQINIKLGAGSLCAAQSRNNKSNADMDAELKNRRNQFNKASSVIDKANETKSGIIGNQSK